jgi:hypothetical protein
VAKYKAALRETESILTTRAAVWGDVTIRRLAGSFNANLGTIAGVSIVALNRCAKALTLVVTDLVLSATVPIITAGPGVCLEGTDSSCTQAGEAWVFGFTLRV